VTVAGTTTFTAANQTSQLTATEGLADGTSQDVTSQATWQSSNPAIATVSATGLVTSGALGQATITATFQGLSGTAVTTLAVNLTGTWSGAGSDSTGPTEWLATLTQAGSTAVFLVSGPVSFVVDGMPGNGQFTGTVSAYSARVPFVITGAAYAGNLTCNLAISGYAQTSNTTFIAPYTGTNSCVGPVSGQFTLTAQ
jgi:trimeric autotransporter adhesin